METHLEINPENLRTLCWKNNYKGVTALAHAIKRSRTTVHRAVKNPRRYGPTLKLIAKALHEK